MLLVLVPTVPIISALFNLFVLSDTVVYLSDLWAPPIVFHSYIIMTLILYMHTDFVFANLPWNNVERWYDVVGYIFAMQAIGTLTHITIAIIT